MLSSRGIMKDNHEFKELYQTIVRGTTFALVRLAAVESGEDLISHVLS